MYDLEWAELAEQLSQDYPAVPTDVILRHVSEAAEAATLFGITDDAILRARTMVHHSLDELASRKAAADRSADIVAQRGSAERVGDEDDDRQPA